MRGRPQTKAAHYLQIQKGINHMTKDEFDLWSNINNPNNDADIDDWADAHNPNNDAYLGDDDDEYESDTIDSRSGQAI